MSNAVVGCAGKAAKSGFMDGSRRSFTKLLLSLPPDAVVIIYLYFLLLVYVSAAALLFIYDPPPLQDTTVLSSNQGGAGELFKPRVLCGAPAGSGGLGCKCPPGCRTSRG